VAVPTKIHSLHDAPCDWMFGPSTRNSHHPSHTTPAWNVGVAAGRVCGGTAHSHQAQTVMTTYPGRRTVAEWRTSSTGPSHIWCISDGSDWWLEAAGSVQLPTRRISQYRTHKRLQLLLLCTFPWVSFRCCCGSTFACCLLPSLSPSSTPFGTSSHHHHHRMLCVCRCRE
jgi:hypothetical protein